ncbi:MAG: APC family permease [Thermoprotei archaeon]
MSDTETRQAADVGAQLTKGAETTKTISAVVEADRKLKRELSAFDLLGLSMGAIIGSGWLFAVNAAAAVAGPSVILSWIIGGILILFVALVYAEISAMLPRSGAIVRYPHYTHGSYTGYIMGWAYLLSAVTVPTIEAEAVVGYAASYIPSLTTHVSTVFGQVIVLSPPGIAFAFALIVIFFFLNYAGIKVLGKTNTAVTVWKIVIPVLTFLFLFAIFDKTNITSLPGGFFPYGVSSMFLALPTAGIVFAYLGFRQALEFGGEAKNPQRDVPRVTVLSILIAMVIYTILQIAYLGAVKWGVAGVSPGDWADLTSKSVPYSSGPLYTALAKSGLAALAAFSYVLLFDAYVSPSGTGWIYIGTGTRSFYGLATDGYFPQAFMRVNKRGVPWISLIATFIVGIFFLLPFPSWYLLVGFISSATVFTYMMGGAGILVFRKTASQLARPFRLSGAKILAPIAFIAAAMIVYWSGFTVLFFVFTAILAGLPLYYIFYAPTRLGVPRGLSAALGLVFWAILGYLSYYGYHNIVYYYASVVTPSGTITASQGANIFHAFLVYYPALATLTIVYTLIYNLLPQPEKRKQVASGWWLILFSLAMLLVSFLGVFGPLPVNGSTPIGFPLDNIIMVVVSGVFYAAAYFSGYYTEDLKELLLVEGVTQQKPQ